MNNGGRVSGGEREADRIISKNKQGKWMKWKAKEVEEQYLW